MAGIPIYDLRSGQCKFATTPFDAKQHLFCAEPVEYEGCPYCPEHAARCFDRRTDEQKRANALRLELARAARKSSTVDAGRKPQRPADRSFRDELYGSES